MKLLGYAKEHTNKQIEKERPPFLKQLKEYKEGIRLKIEKKDRTFKVWSIILITLYFYVTGVITTFLRYFGEIKNLGLRESPKPSGWPWTVVAALFDFRYSIKAYIITLIIAIVILLWWIRKNIALDSKIGRASCRERV